MATASEKKVPIAIKTPVVPAKKIATAAKVAAKRPAKAVATVATAKPVVVAKPVVAKVIKSAVKPVIKPVIKPAAKPAPKSLAKVAEKSAATKPVIVKAKKAKLVRDSFTMPEAEYEVLGDVKKVCLAAGIEVKKSQLLRIGVLLLSKMDVASLRTQIAHLEPLKAGRPKKEK